MRESCPKCHFKNAIRSKFCNQCGSGLPMGAPRDMKDEHRQSEHRDIAHPITLECREYIQKKVLDAYERETGGARTAPSYSAPERTPERSREPERTREPEPAKAEMPPEPMPPADDTGDIQL